MPEAVTTGPRGWEPGSRPLLRAVLGRVLRRTRQEQGRTLAEVAQAARVSLPYLSELERGRKEASSEVLGAVCEALAIDLSDLLLAAGHRLAGETARPGPVTKTGPGPVARTGRGQVVDLASARRRRLDRHRLAAGDDLVGQAVVDRIPRAEGPAPVRVLADRSHRVAGVPTEDLVHLGSDLADLPGLHGQVRQGAAGLRRRLVQHHLRVA